MLGNITRSTCYDQCYHMLVNSQSAFKWYINTTGQNKKRVMTSQRDYNAFKDETVMTVAPKINGYKKVRKFRGKPYQSHQPVKQMH